MIYVEKKNVVDEEVNRTQKNLRLSEEAKKLLEKGAVEKFGSKQKQGQYVEFLLKKEEKNTHEMLEEIHSEVVGESSHSQNQEENTTHTQNIEQNEKSEFEEIKKDVESEGEVNLDEYDLTEIKGMDGRVDVVTYLVKQEFEDEFTRKDVQEWIIKNVGYSGNGARSLAKQVCSNFTNSLQEGKVNNHD